MSKYICIDVDDTVLVTSGFPDYKNAVPIEGAVESVNRLVDKGNTVDFFTGRHHNLYDHTFDQLVSAGFKFRRLITGKPPYDIMIDDKAFNFKKWEGKEE